MDLSKRATSVYNNSYTRTQFKLGFVYYNWEIDDFENVYENLNDLSSPKFPETGIYQIKMEFHEIFKTQIHFHFITRPFRGSCSIDIQEQDENGQLYSYNSSCTLDKVRNKTFKCVTNKTTYSCTLDLLRIPAKLRIHCSIHIIHEILNNSVHTPLFSTNLEIRERLFPICDSNSKFDDTKLIKFIVNGKSYSVPKHILCATNSSYFKDLCEKNVKEDATHEINIQQNKAYYFRIMLIYINTGVIKHNMSSLEYEELLKTAHEYDVQHLKLICEQYLLHCVTKETAVGYIQLAWLCDAKYLENHAVNIIKLHYDTIVSSEDFQFLLQENFNKIKELFEKTK